MCEGVMKYRKQLLTILPMALLLGMTAVAEAQSAQEIIVATDKVRNPDKPFRSTLRLTEYVGGQERDHDSMVLYSKEDGATRQFRNLVQYVEPARDAGKRVLLDGHSLWFYDPNSKVSVRISAQQRLIGQAAIGDILTVNLAADYTPNIVGTETIDDATRQPRKCWRLELKASNDLATYNRVEYWVEQGTFFPVKGEFCPGSRGLRKTPSFPTRAKTRGRSRPTEVVVIDAVDSSLATTATLGE